MAHRTSEHLFDFVSCRSIHKGGDIPQTGLSNNRTQTVAKKNFFQVNYLLSLLSYSLLNYNEYYRYCSSYYKILHIRSAKLIKLIYVRLAGKRLIYIIKHQSFQGSKFYMACNQWKMQHVHEAVCIHYLQFHPAPSTCRKKWKASENARKIQPSTFWRNPFACEGGERQNTYKSIHMHIVYFVTKMCKTFAKICAIAFRSDKELLSEEELQLRLGE